MSDQKHSNQRGRSATRPAHIPLSGWKDILLRTKDELSDDHVSVVSAGVAFFGLLAAFPAIAATISIAGLVVDPAVIEGQIEAWTGALPADAARILQAQARKVATGADTSLGWAALLSILLAIYGASKGMKTLMEGMNVAYDEDEDRGFVRLNLVALSLTVLLILALLVAIGFMLGVPILLDAIGISANWEAVLTYARWLVLAVIAVGGLSVLYRYGPSRDDPKWRWITPGSSLAILIWIAGSIGFSFYVRNFSSYNETYGTLGGVIVLLTWLWLSAYIVLLGAELDSEIEHQTCKDTTTGAPEPMGERGAVVADTVGETKK
ncbi:YihY/virulence factor BrkB family protein (plasmid) [Croceicoccus marinus]|uniref:YihY/virulence factor BrkB family protein n=1 Tax=Croceicoccus marinus TaxID=450378 RepID=A0A1Z1FG09_9SPHN|nr:hypothetical protein A9D14_15345 [Croceicoccus marinus]QNE07208.1 YihY/virulence factor BrkB family protein [Croceicoccus marinus]